PAHDLGPLLLLRPAPSGPCPSRFRPDGRSAKEGSGRGSGSRCQRIRRLPSPFGGHPWLTACATSTAAAATTPASASTPGRSARPPPPPRLTGWTTGPF